ncbi:hypothetical protein E1211_26900 [Micromonospora sp. 15K316]|uniref:hypothetical protein n=1 Tax=Micromonospora sp. 15K316 TaxID=2530376 RepID=UPI001049CA5F|nr:hypothetical protein [Micromonospora sp. 15K316]TDC28955.1 hypothetical protein E1211_26900 [Micromonospora sp. 15K316]
MSTRLVAGVMMTVVSSETGAARAGARREADTAGLMMIVVSSETVAAAAGVRVEDDTTGLMMIVVSSETDGPTGVRAGSGTAGRACPAGELPVELSGDSCTAVELSAAASFELRVRAWTTVGRSVTGGESSEGSSCPYGPPPPMSIPPNGRREQPADQAFLHPPGSGRPWARPDGTDRDLVA